MAHYDLTLEQALTVWLQALEKLGALRTLPAESVALEQSLGRITAVSVWARQSAPRRHQAAMDGYAVHAAETRAASPRQPVRLLLGQQAFAVKTDDPVPAGCDAVYPREDVVQSDDGAAILLVQPAVRWQHMRTIGEDLVKSQLIVPANHRLRAADLGAIARAGHRQVRVYRRPRIAILSAEGEGAHAEQTSVNALVLGAMIEGWGAECRHLPVAPGEEEAVLQASLADHDLVVINLPDMPQTAELMSRYGAVVVENLALRPGHSTLLGHAQAKPVVGLSRYLAGAMLTFDRLVWPLLQHWLGQDEPYRPHIQARLTQAITASSRYDELVRMRLGEVEGHTIAFPVSRGAGATMAMVQADGVLHVARGAEPKPAGAMVDVMLLRSQQEIAHSIIHQGSHDLTIDLLADLLHRNRPHRVLRSHHVGSLGGLQALARGEAHFASAHLLDPDSGRYNLPYLQQHLAGRPLVVLHFVQRVQGLIVAPGNPKNIRSLEDLLRPDVSFLNRQAGSGTRVLLDYQLQQHGLSPAAIQGYTRSETTHLAVAAAVQNGTADCALGILAVARALQLDFVPLFEESYQLIFPKTSYESELVAPLLTIIRSTRFAQTVAALGGYDVQQMGEIAAMLP